MVEWFMDDELEKMKTYVQIPTQYFLEEIYEILGSDKSV
jgi:hypothetical protein